MPRYRQEDVPASSGVHRRRYERRGSNTPIVVGGVVVGLALVVVLGYVLGLFGRKDPAAEKNAIRVAARTFLVEARRGNRDRIFAELIDVTGGKGWVNLKLQQEARKRYRFWNDPSYTEEQKRENAELRQNQNERMWTEISGLDEKMKFADDATIDRVVNAAEPDIQQTFATIRLRNMGGELELILAGHGDSWVVQHWNLVHEAM